MQTSKASERKISCGEGELEEQKVSAPCLDATEVMKTCTLVAAMKFSPDSLMGEAYGAMPVKSK